MAAVSGPPEPPEEVSEEKTSLSADQDDKDRSDASSTESTRNDPILISPNPPPDEEAVFFSTIDKNDELKRQQIRKYKLKNDRQEQDNKLSKRYASRAYRFSKWWVGFLLLFIPVQVILRCFSLGLREGEFIAVIGSLSASVLGYWWLVGRYLFPSNPK